LKRFLAGEYVPEVPIDHGAWLNFLAHVEKQERRRATAERADLAVLNDPADGTYDSDPPSEVIDRVPSRAAANLSSTAVDAQAAESSV
jgi:hypothetical protein